MRENIFKEIYKLLVSIDSEMMKGNVNYYLKHMYNPREGQQEIIERSDDVNILTVGTYHPHSRALAGTPILTVLSVPFDNELKLARVDWHKTDKLVFLPNMFMSQDYFNLDINRNETDDEVMLNNFLCDWLRETVAYLSDDDSYFEKIITDDDIDDA